MIDYLPVRDAVATACRRLATEGLLIGTSGNVSVVDSQTGNVAVTATGVVLADCRAEQVSIVDSQGRLVDGDFQPTSELELHLGVIAATGVGAVVHTHAPAATAVSCVRDSLPVIHYQQLLLGGEIAVAPYATFGTSALADSVNSALAGRSAVLMANHGAVTTGATIEQAVENSLLLEWLCRLLIDSSALGSPRFLDESAQAAVIEAAINRSYGTVQPVTTDNKEN
ncbi:class II aldolase/adducin family protein [Aeromicrobium sp.]|uniref:class II aldolase/adducin family protein n=1 Tax=Aeromicrobium sp. TaxID=1871063 RepID=UPI002FC75DB8